MNSNDKWQERSNPVLFSLDPKPGPGTSQLFISEAACTEMHLIIIKIVDYIPTSITDNALRKFSTRSRNRSTLGTVPKVSGSIRFYSLNIVRYDQFRAESIVVIRRYLLYHTFFLDFPPFS